jgi:hypothetical protein
MSGRVFSSPETRAKIAQNKNVLVFPPPIFGERRRITKEDGDMRRGKWLESLSVLFGKNKKGPWSTSWQTTRGFSFRRFPSRTCQSYFLWGGPSKPICGCTASRALNSAFPALPAGNRPCTGMASTSAPPSPVGKSTWFRFTGGAAQAAEPRPPCCLTFSPPMPSLSRCFVRGLCGAVSEGGR